MRFCAGQSRTELALFAGLRAARGTTNRQRFFLGDFHAYTMHGNSARRWSILTILQSLKGSSSLQRLAGQLRKFWRSAFAIARISHSIFLRVGPCSINRPRTQKDLTPCLGALLDSEPVRQSELPAPAYKPYTEEPSASVYKPYAETPASEPRYEPYKRI
jgi:hypothetical protein